MQVFESPVQDDSKSVLLYIHGPELQHTALDSNGRVGRGIRLRLRGTKLSDVPPTDLYTGTWEVFYTNIVKTYGKMKASWVDVRLHTKEKMGHVFPLWPCPEGKETRKAIAEIIASTSNISMPSSALTEIW